MDEDEEWFELKLANRWSGKVYETEIFDNLDDATKEGERFWKEFPHKDESDLVLIHHIRKTETLHTWEMDGDQ